MSRTENKEGKVIALEYLEVDGLEVMKGLEYLKPNDQLRVQLEGFSLKLVNPKTIDRLLSNIETTCDPDVIEGLSVNGFVKYGSLQFEADVTTVKAIVSSYFIIGRFKAEVILDKSKARGGFYTIDYV